MNTAVLMFSACLVGADPVPVTTTTPAPIVASSSGCTGGCGTATVHGSVGDCDPCSGHKIGLLAKIKAKLCSPCGHDCKPEPVCVKPEPVCVKAAPICKVETTCDPCAKVCWKPGMLLHKIKDKFSHLCHKDGCVEATPVCSGGCATAATPGGCGSVVIPPSTVAPPMALPTTPIAPMPIPPAVAPKNPEPKALPKPVAPTAPKVVTIPPTPYNPNLTLTPVAQPKPVLTPAAPVIVPIPTAPRTLDLGPAPF